MIAYLFLTLGCGGTLAAAYAVAPAGRGAHRYVASRSKLRAEAATAQGAADELAAALVATWSERDRLAAQHEEDQLLLASAEQLVQDLEARLRAFDATCAENTSLRAELENITAIRPLQGADGGPPAAVMPLAKAPFALSRFSEPR
ncbi:hypothetical protein ACIQPQ_34655 [Streptomyces sp. NPDC091281]|uniref:hypothetical protein n=1 Tax=Streptomyces sp. NPDC091281 TaxID=3365985 RepID=UPI00382874CF